MIDEDEGARSRLATLIANPRQLRRIGRVGVAIATLGTVIAQALDGSGASLLAALCWVLLPVFALAIGAGDGFFVGHGIGRRRVLLTALAGAVVALAACALLAGVTTASQKTAARMLDGVLYGVLYASVALAAGAWVALLFGRGSDYLARKIDERVDEEW